MKKLFTLFVLVVVSTAVHAQKYHYDVNGDGMVNITDVTCLVNKILGVLNPGEVPPSYLACPDTNHPHLIDLGLPSGTLWACCNVDTEDLGKQCPSYHGGYYAWGETVVKEEYSWSTYAYGSRPSDCIDLGYDIARTQYDVAHVKWGGCWMMPSFDQMKELGNNCTCTRTSMDGVEGALFTGPSGGTIFLPVAGYYWYDELMDAGNNGYYWSSTQNPSEAYDAYALYFGTSSAYNSYSRQYGHCVRPVCPANLLLSTTSLYLAPGAVGTVDITLGSGSYTVESSDPGVATATLEGSQVTVTAMDLGQAVVTVTDMLTGQKETIEVAVFDNLSLSTTSLHLVPDSVKTVEITSGSGSYTVESSDLGVATATLEGSQVTVTATGLGDAVVTVTDILTGQKETIEVVIVDLEGCPDDHHPHMVDLGLPSGTKWACCNVDTENPGKQSPTNYGGYYAWGETDEKGNYSWSNYTHCSGSANTCRYLGLDIAGTQYDVAHVKWGGTWVMPSMDQYKELINNCTFEYTTRDGVKGGKFTSKANGRSIFLPAAGFRYDSDLYGVSTYGRYWLSPQDSSYSNYAYYLVLASGSTNWNYYYRYIGQSVRPVARN